MSAEEIVFNYDHIINPYNLLQTEEEFSKFLNVPATKEELISFLRICEENDLYEWCIDINNKINEI